ncbi:DUF998 domain-containing protein [Stackebrandtia nassauensis]|uniref:DUF998 domain-containing protein n=1 Tax=Stackebrandtia nassauensis (strain DSM 44728 / CIP 108903 / NRRL B-16338 / NBRC 102104 / LLR-40K-21) TaxID=446470 RepID=D3Q1Z4_STANL|nr:DUF998 domain-containing protein [Stackebrandtia nassauensis]ADD41861.1 hypothetical protein Snas_2169 [Stackebrandtia nassauensis DSM 44728]
MTNHPTLGPRPTWTARGPAQAHRDPQLPWYAGLALVAGILTMAILIAMHVIMADQVRVNIDPVSVFAINREGVLLFDLACLSIAVACVAVLFGPLGSERVTRRCLAGSAVALLFVVGFDTDAGATVSSFSGYVHRYAAGAVFVMITVATAHLWRRVPDPRLRRAFAVMTLINLVLLILNVWGTYLPDLAYGGQWRGIPQRLLVVSQVVSIVAMAFVPKAKSPRSRRTPSRHRSQPRDFDPSWDRKDWLTGRGTTGWGALPSADGL